MSDTAGGGEPFNVGSFIAQAIDEGLSMRAARDLFRAQGMQMANQSFASMYAQVRDAIGEREAIQGIDYEAIPDPAVYGRWSAGRGDQFATFVTSYVRPLGERDVEERFYLHLTDDPHTAADAVRAAERFYTDEALVGDSLQGGVYQGSVVTSMVRT